MSELRNWKHEVMKGYDEYDEIILQISRPEDIGYWRARKTHTEIAEAYLSKLIQDGQ